MLLLIIRELQTSHNSRRTNHKEIISEYRKHKALTYYIEQDILAIACFISIVLLKAFSKKIHTAYTMWIIHILYFFLFYRFNKIVQAFQSLPCAYSTDYDKQVVDH